MSTTADHEESEAQETETLEGKHLAGMPEQSNEDLEVNGNGSLPTPDLNELKSIIEALLFVSSDPIPIERLLVVLSPVCKADIRAALLRLQSDYDQRQGGLQIVEVAGGFQISTRPEFAPWIKQFGKSKSSGKLSRSGLETLAIIAYKQPIVRAEIEEIRGVETAGVLRTLLERKLVRIVGRKEMPGRPIMYGTTKYFLQHFGLRDLTELPPLREVKELGDAAQVLLPDGDGPLEIGENGTMQEGADFVEAVSSKPVE